MVGEQSRLAQNEVQKPVGQRPSVERPKCSARVSGSIGNRGAFAGGSVRVAASADGLIKNKGVVSNAFRLEIREALNSIPQPVRVALHKGGYSVVLCQSVPSAVPNARYQKVRGYSANTSWSEVAGMFDRRNKRVVLAEQGKEHGRLVTPERRLGILRHEVGHAFDNYLGNFSHSPAFKRAYESSVARIPAAERPYLSYYLQPGSGGIEETFAELFASCQGQGCDSTIDELLHRRFPALAAMINDILARYQG